MRSLMQNSFINCLLILTFICISSISFAAIDSYQFDSIEQERAFQELAKQLRCPKCQNQNILDSNAGLALDMRNKTYEMVKAGQSEQQVIDYMVARFGNFVRYDPPMTPATIFLWLGPLFFIVIGVFFVIRLSKKSNQQFSSLDPLESARLKEILTKTSSTDKKGFK